MLSFYAKFISKSKSNLFQLVSKLIYLYIVRNKKNLPKIKFFDKAKAENLL